MKAITKGIEKEVLLAILLTAIGCLAMVGPAIFFALKTKDPLIVNSGEIKNVPGADMIAIGTDSTIVIVDKKTGNVSSVINRK